MWSCARKALLNALVLVLVQTLSGPGAVRAQESACELRGTWLQPYSFATPERRADSLAKAKQANLNTLFVLAPPIGDNRGWSTHESFLALVDEAKAAGFKVHVWVANLYRVSGGVNFADPAEQQRQVKWAMDLLAKYPLLDGVHFDYIRYPGHWETGEGWPPVDRAKVEGVTDTVRLTHQAVHQAYPEKVLTAAVYTTSTHAGSTIATIADFDGEYIPTWFRDWITAHPGNRYTTSQYPNGRYVPVYMKVQQDPVAWLQEGAIDAIIPMNYTTHDPSWQLDVDTWISFLDGPRQGLFMGISWEEARGLDAPGVARKIKAGRASGLKGFVIFKIGSRVVDDSLLIQALTVDSAANDYHAPYKEPAPACLPGGEPDRLRAEAFRVPQPIRVNGDIADFRDATGFEFADDSGRGAQDNRTDVRLLWDLENLYLAVEVKDTQLHAEARGHDGEVWKDDAVEVFIDPADDGGAQFSGEDYRIAVNLLDALMDSRGSWDDHRSWDGDAEHRVLVAGTVNDDQDVDVGYTLELAIPWSDLGVVPQAGLEMGLDVAVDDRDDLESDYQYSDWAGLASFNRPWAWGKLKLSAESVPAPTFSDVPFDHPYHDEIEALYRAGYAVGCGTDPLRYCPDQAMSRAESAVFVERGVHGVDVAPPDPGDSIFADMDLGYWGLKWATALYQDGYTIGCGIDPLRYCPQQGHTRAEGAVFYLRMLHGVDYQPPAASGIFVDVPVDWWGAKWAEAAYEAGLIPACEEAPLGFCPGEPLTRGLAALMMARAKGLTS